MHFGKISVACVVIRFCPFDQMINNIFFFNYSLRISMCTCLIYAADKSVTYASACTRTAYVIHR